MGIPRRLKSFTIASMAFRLRIDLFGRESCSVEEKVLRSIQPGRVQMKASLDVRGTGADADSRQVVQVRGMRLPRGECFVHDFPIGDLAR